MATSSPYETNDMYLMSTLSLFYLLLFVVIKFNAPWSKEKYLLYLIAVWTAFHLTAMVLFSVQHSHTVEFPQELERSLNTILATTSLWGVAVIQNATIIYTFAVLGNELWWKLAAALECVEFGLILLFALIPQVPTPIELAYILPYTSQAAAIGVIWTSSRGSFRIKIQKHTADHLLGLGLLTCIISAVLLSLSLVGYFPRWMTLQWVLFMVITTVAYRLPGNANNNNSPTSGSETELTPMSGLRSTDGTFPESSPRLNEQASGCARASLPEESKGSAP